MLDQLKDDIDKLNGKSDAASKQHSPKSPQNCTNETSKSTTNKKSTEPNPVVDNFQFEVKHTIHCLK